MIRLISPVFIFFLLLLLTREQSVAYSADTVYRSLISPSETIRFREIHRLTQDPQRLRRYLSSVSDALVEHGDESGVNRPPEASTVAIFDLIGKMKDDESEKTLRLFLDSPNPELSMLAMGQLGRYRYDGAIDAVSNLRLRPEYFERYAYRFAVIRALIEMHHADAIESLLTLRQKLDGQLRYHIDTFFKGLTVDDFAGDSDRFEEFKQGHLEQEREEAKSSMKGSSDSALKNSSGFFTAASTEPESMQRMRLKPQQYYGIDIHSKRLLFILDHSGSMKDPWYGMTRLARAKGELIKAIRELPGDVEFGIVCFHTRIHQWQEDLVEATEANKDLAIDFVNRLGYGDRTNTYGVLRAALDYDKDLEAIYLLTDGKPTIGELVSHQSILMDILHRNRFRHLNLNTIGIAVDGFTRQFLKRLADESGGEFRDAR